VRQFSGAVPQLACLEGVIVAIRIHLRPYRQREAILDFLRVEVPRKWRDYCDEVSDNFRIIDPKDFRVLG
jgi:hypothetical protein